MALEDSLPVPEVVGSKILMIRLDDNNNPVEGSVEATTTVFKPGYIFVTGR